MMKPYNLLIAIGTSPQVLTETIWSLVVQEAVPRVPRAIHVVTTMTGERKLKAALFDTATAGGVSVWDRMAQDFLGGAKVDWHFHVAIRPTGHKIDDIRTWDDDRRFAEMCYRVVADLMTAPAALPVVGSIAGGRKTMSAHLLTAFLLYARPGDEAVHVLVEPEELVLKNKDFFYPSERDEVPVRIERVDLNLLNMRPQLEELARIHRAGALPRTLGELEQLPGMNFATAARPDHVRVSLGNRNERSLVLCDAQGGVLEQIQPIAPNALVLLLILVDLADREEVSNQHLVDNPAIERRRRELLEYCRDDAQPRPWNETSISQQISELNKLLDKHPLAAKYLKITGQRGRDDTRYYWPNGRPSLKAHTRQVTDLMPWPLSSIPLNA